MSRREFMKATLATSAVAAFFASTTPRLAESHPLGGRKPLPVWQYTSLWLENARDKSESWRLDLNDEKQFEAACYLLRDWRANQVRACSPWLLHTAALMQAVIAEFVSQRPIKVLSGLRMPSTNIKEGGCKNSFHLPDQRGLFYAMDFSIDGIPCEKVGALGLFLQQGGVGIYHSKDFVHLDVGNPRTWEK